MRRSRTPHRPADNAMALLPADAAIEVQLSGAEAIEGHFSSLFGPVQAERRSGAGLKARLRGLKLWRLQLWRVELSPHRIVLPPALARPGTHPFNHVRYQVAGTAYFEQDGNTIAIAPGDCVAINLSRPHVLWSDEQTCHESVTLPLDLVRLQSVPVELLWVRRIARQDLDDVARFAQRMLQTLLDAPPALPLSAAASVGQTLIDLLNLSFSHDVASETGFTRAAMTRFRAKSFIIDHLRETELNVAQVAAALGCSSRYLNTVFAEEGLSPARFIWRMRLERCRAEIESPVNVARSLTDIAFGWGFSSASHFTRAFRDQFGYPPSQARARSAGSQ